MPSASPIASGKTTRARSKQTMRAAGGRAWAGKCDVADEKSVAAFFEQAVSELGPVDILVNNAGVARDAHIALLGLPQWQQVMHVNLDGVVPLRARRRARHAAAALGPHHQRVIAERAHAAARANRVRRIQSRARRVDARVVARSRCQGRARQRGLARAHRDGNARHDAGRRPRGASARRSRSAAPARRAKSRRWWRFWRQGRRAISPGKS